MKRELKEYGSYYEILENGKVVYCKNSDGYSYECTYDSNNNKLTYIENGVMIRDNRPKKVTIELTQEQLDKIKESGLLK